MAYFSVLFDVHCQTDAPHVLGGRREEVDAVVPRDVGAGEPEERLGDELGRRQREARTLGARVGRGDAAQLGVQHRAELIERGGISGLPRAQEHRHLHPTSLPQRRERSVVGELCPAARRARCHRARSGWLFVDYLRRSAVASAAP